MAADRPASRRRSIPIWSFAYFRFWVVKTMMRTSPVMAFTGTPIYNAYLRLMGAQDRPQRRHQLAAAGRFAPTCSRSATIRSCARTRSSSAIARSRTSSTSARSRSAANAFVGEASVIDIDTAMGDDTQLGHASSLQSGQRVPDGKRYHGSPAVETTSDYCPIESRKVGALRSAFYACARTRGAAPYRRAGADPRLSFLGPVCGAGDRREPRRLRAVAARHFGGGLLRRADRRARRGLRRSRACACCSSSPASPIRPSASIT